MPCQLLTVSNEPLRATAPGCPLLGSSAVGPGVTVEARPPSPNVLSTVGAGTQTSAGAGVAWGSDGGSEPGCGHVSELGLHHPFFLAGRGAGTEGQALPSSLPGRGYPSLRGGL